MGIFKNFKLFNEMNGLQFSEKINDYLLSFSDEGFNVENRYPAGGIVIYNRDNNIEFSQIKHDLESLLSYISSVVSINSVVIDFEPIDKPRRRSKVSTHTFSIKRNEFDTELISDIDDSYPIRLISLEF